MKKVRLIGWQVFFAGVSALLVFSATPVYPAAYMKVGDIAGESTDAGHEGWIEIESFSWGLSQPGTSIPQLPAIQDISIVHEIDKASPKLMLACAAGQLIADVTLTIVVEPPAGTIDNPVRTTTIVLTDAIISSVRPGGSSSSGDVLPLEEVSFNFAKIEIEYMRQMPGGPVLDMEEALIINPARSQAPK